MVLGLYHTALTGSRCLRQQVLQFPQCFTADGGRRCRGNATAGNGIEHPLRHLQQARRVERLSPTAQH
jgi:hypothetical protein